MAGPNILREYLVALGFKVDDPSYKDFQQKFQSTSQAFEQLGKIAVATGIALMATIGKTASEMEKLYYISQRTGASVGTLIGARFGAEQIGIGAEELSGAIEGIAATIRSNPGMSVFFKQLGIAQVSDNAQNLVNLVARLQQLGPPGSMGYAIAVQIAGQFGISERMLLMLEQKLPKFMASAREQKKLLADAGVDADKLAADSTQFMNDFRKLEAHVQVLVLLFEQHLLPVGERILHFLTAAVDLIIGADKATGGWSTTIGGILTALGGVLTAFRLLRGLGAMIGIGGAATAAAGGGGAAAGGAAVAEGGAFLGGPIVWAIIAAVAAATLAWVNRNKIKAGFEFLKEKTNVAIGNVRDLIAGYEGKRLQKYRDAGGYSIGYGHFIKPGENFDSGISNETALRLLAQDTKTASEAVMRLVHVQLNSNQLMALTDFVYNIGADKFSKSTLLKDINAGDFAAAAQEFVKWNKVMENGAFRTSADLTNRRLGERDLFTKPDVTLNQETNIHISGGNPHEAANEVVKNQTRVNGDLLRNMSAVAVN